MWGFLILEVVGGLLGIYGAVQTSHPIAGSLLPLVDSAMIVSQSVLPPDIRYGQVLRYEINVTNPNSRDVFVRWSVSIVDGQLVKVSLQSAEVSDLPRSEEIMFKSGESKVLVVVVDSAPSLVAAIDRSVPSSYAGNLVFEIVR